MKSVYLELSQLTRVPKYQVFKYRDSTVAVLLYYFLVVHVRILTGEQSWKTIQ